nr:MAG TPA: intron associated endonuclease [Caudoviricetes sp.]
MIKTTYIVYLTINTINQKIYVGVHEIESNKFDGYLGCGVYTTRPATYCNPKTPFQFAIKKYGPKKFIRITLKEFNTAEEAYKLEQLIVNESFVKREDTYNLVLGGQFHTEQINSKKTVYVYDLNGNFVEEFPSLDKAAKWLNPKAHNGGHISRAIKTGYTYMQHQFSYTKVPFMKKKKAKKPKEFNTIPNTGPKVGQYDKNGKLIKVFDSITACRKAGFINANKCVQGLRTYCNGYKFLYVN